MKRWKQALAAVLALGLLAGCAGGAPSPAPTATPSIPMDQAEKPALTRETFPRLDGSTSTAPLARAICAVLLGESLDSVSDLVNFSRTSRSYRMLMYGEADLLIAAEPSESVLEEKADVGFAWEMAPIATDALVFLVNENNPVDSLTVEQVQKIYTGEITNWKEVGGEDRPIIPFQRNAEAGSQTLMKKLVMGELELMEPESEYIAGSMGGLIEAVRSFDGSPGAIGYTVYYYANDMNMADGLKVIAIDGAAPDAASIRSGAYPFTNPYYVTIAADEPADSTARKVFDWLQGPVGQSLIGHEGYVSIQENPAPVDWELQESEPVEELYTRLFPEPMETLLPSDRYGQLLPYAGAMALNEWGEQIYKYGLVTREGMLVTDPVYEDVYRPAWYDYEGEKNRAAAFFCLTRTVGEGDGAQCRYAMAALDGSWGSDFNWLHMEVVDDQNIWAIDLNGDGVMLDEKGNTRWRLSMTGEDWNADAVCWFGARGIIPSDPYAIIDLEGQVTYLDGEEPPRDPTVFCDGLSTAHADGDYDRWGYINTAGEWVIEPRYASVENFHNGLAIVTEQGGGSAIVDTEGNVLLSMDGYLTRMSSAQGDWYLNYGKVVEEDGWSWSYFVGGVYDEKLTPLAWNQIGQTLSWGSERFLARRTEEGLQLLNPYESIFLPVGAKGYVSSWYEDLLLCNGEGPEGQNLWSAWRMDGTCIFGAGEQTYLSFSIDSVTGEVYFIAETAGDYYLYDRDGNYLAQFDGWPYIQDGLVRVTDDRSCSYLTLDGKAFFRISQMKSQED